MEALELLFILALPGLGMLALVLAMDRWGKKHDPMGGKPGLEHYSTMGTGESRDNRREDQT